MFSLFNDPISFLGIFGAFLVAITVHECAHAWAADRMGDPTAKLLGRLTLNPLAHLDPLGTLMLLFAPFGWAKPVPVDSFNLRHPRRDHAIISLSGPVANLSVAIILSLFLQLISFFLMPTFAINFVASFLRLIVVLNINLAIFNLIPIHPLDGFAVVEGILPEEYARQWHELQGYGPIFLLFLIFPLFGHSSPLINFISPIISFITGILLPPGGII